MQEIKEKLLNLLNVPEIVQLKIPDSPKVDTIEIW